MKWIAILALALAAAFTAGAKTRAANRDCSGNACAYVTWRATEQGMWFTNHHDSRRIEVRVTNWAAQNSATIEPTDTELIETLWYAAPWTANFAD